MSRKLIFLCLYKNCINKKGSHQGVFLRPMPSPAKGGGALQNSFNFISFLCARGGGTTKRSGRAGRIVYVNCRFVDLAKWKHNNPSPAIAGAPFAQGSLLLLGGLRGSSLWSHAVDPHMEPIQIPPKPPPAKGAFLLVIRGSSLWSHAVDPSHGSTNSS